MPASPLNHAISAIPHGPWAVGVSGGADSVALLMLLRARPDLRLQVAHLDHETRAGESALDAAFVADLCKQNAIPCTIARRSEIEPLAKNLPANRSARFRALRFALFQTVCNANDLQGVILAHHAGDQAETIFQRLLRNSGPAGLGGMRSQTRMNGLIVLHPLLGIAPKDLREFLRSQNQLWREDASNSSTVYQRNRVRAMLTGHPKLSESLLETGRALESLAAWTRAAAPVLPAEITVRDLEECPEVLAQSAARRWLIEQGVPRSELTPPVILRLTEMARDAATPPRQHFPGGILLARRKGRIFVMTRPATMA
jgi:tRNA(Ile)-lysidine synthase